MKYRMEGKFGNQTICRKMAFWQHHLTNHVHTFGGSYFGSIKTKPANLSNTNLCQIFPQPVFFFRNIIFQGGGQTNILRNRGGIGYS